MQHLLRSWIAKVLEQHRPLLAIAIRQRAKFEGWLKFELALYAELHGATSVEVEAPSGSGSRSDLTFLYDGERYDVELKTANGAPSCARLAHCNCPERPESQPTKPLEFAPAQPTCPSR